MYDIRIFDNKQDLTPISFKLNEAYLMPVNSGSTVYNCVLDFYSIIEGLGADKDPLGLKDIPKPLNSSKLIKPDYFDIKIRTYKTYKEWLPYVSYNKGDKVTYYDKIYISAIDKYLIPTLGKFAVNNIGYKELGLLDKARIKKMEKQPSRLTLRIWWLSSIPDIRKKLLCVFLRF